MRNRRNLHERITLMRLMLVALGVLLVAGWGLIMYHWYHTQE